jgi:hypothetical protein
MTDDEFHKLFDTFKYSAYRLETLPQYLVDEERDDYAAFLAGKPPPPDNLAEWLSLIKDAKRDGKTVTRVHIFPKQLTPYLRFEIETGYKFSVPAGEDVRIIVDPSEVPPGAKRDFWFFDDKIAVLMKYTKGGRYLGAEMAPHDRLDELRRARDWSLEHGIPFAQYHERSK